MVEGAASLYLARKMAAKAELLNTRLVLELFTLREAVVELDDSGRERLRGEMLHGASR
jgi:hypothetical protein